MVRESYKENNKPNGFRTFVNVLRPIRDWLHTMKSSTPISSPISSTTGNNISGHNNHHNNSGSNSYNQDSIAGRSSVDVLSSTTLPTPIHRYTPIVNGFNGHSGHNNVSINGGPPSMMTTMDDMNGSTGGNSTGLENQFSRNAQARMSLPIMQQNKLRRQAYNQLQRRGQQAPRSLGYIYLQHKGETKQATLPNELTTIDTIRALFVCAFPRMLSMEYMSQPHVKIYIYNPSCNIFYELCDIEEVKHESVLRIHHSDPLIPLVLPPQQLPPMQSQHYATIHRLPPRVAPQVPPPPIPPAFIAQQPHHHHQQQQQQQSHMQPHLQQFTPAQQHHLQQHHQMSQHQSMTQIPLAQIPPPKPRRMIPSSYSMHRLNPQQ